MSSGDDWRLMGQERYLQGPTLEWRSWYPSRGPDALGPWDHDHCAFCTVHLADHVLDDDPDTQLAGYTTPDGLYWICRDCFEDFPEWVRLGSHWGTADLIGIRTSGR